MTNKVAIVTGAARGIGRAIALYLADKGCDIVVADIDLNAWKEFGGEHLTASTVMEEVQNLGRRSIGVTADVTKRADVDKLVANTLDEFNKIDILVNNAGGLAGSVDNSWATIVPEDELRATIDRNLIGTIFCCQAVAKHMKDNSAGKIVNMSSQAGMQAQGGGIYASYGAAKAAVIMYTKYLAQELAPFGINVNCVAPAYVETPRLASIYYDKDDNRKRVESLIPLGRLANPIDIAKVVSFLCGEESNYVVGQCIGVCGGAVKF